MQPLRRAVIDVGTNSVKLLVADVEDSRIVPVLETSRQTRLGAGFYPAHVLQTERIQATAAATAEFAKQAWAQGAKSVRVLATSAARDAVNQKELLQTIEGATKLRAEVISGEQEAELAFQGATSDERYAVHPLLLVEVGGGSTQFLLGQGGRVHFRHSFPLGTVRLMDKAPHSDPPAPQELAHCREVVETMLQQEIAPRIRPALTQETQAFAQTVVLLSTGGTASILGAMEARLSHFDRAKLEQTALTAERLRWHEERLWSLSLSERQKIPGLPPNRADVILPGASVYRAVCDCFGFSELRISTRGLRFAAILHWPATQV